MLNNVSIVRCTGVISGVQGQPNAEKHQKMLNMKSAMSFVDWRETVFEDDLLDFEVFCCTLQVILLASEKDKFKKSKRNQPNQSKQSEASNAFLLPHAS